MYKHILVPTDGSRLSEKAIKTAVNLAQLTGAKLTGLYVVSPYTATVSSYDIAPFMVFSPDDYRKATAKATHAALAKAEKSARAAGVRFLGANATHEHPWQAIIENAKKRGCDLIVMASHGRRGIAGLVLGSETTKVLTHSKTPVLVCR